MLKKLSTFFEDSSPSSTHKKREEIFDFLKLIRDWDKIVGPRLAKITIPLSNHNKILIILTNHPAISQTLNFLEGEIKNNIFKEFPILRGKITQLIYQTNPSFFEKKMENKAKLVTNKPPSLHKYSPIYQKLKREADELFFDFEDQELKATLISLYIQCHQ